MMQIIYMAALALAYGKALILVRELDAHSSSSILQLSFCGYFVYKAASNTHNKHKR